ncbi:hypothetical protein JZ785_02735 [Alicyclobacillus curvatus]|nr:hypothetical protein JZ785_02735 [Alicyclobacillus curvatus]
MHIKLSSPKAKPKLTPQQAREITDNMSPYDATEAKQVFVEYQLVTDTATEVPHFGFLHRVPCYIVSYEGLHLPSHQSTPGGPTAPGHTEVNFVIDANTGQPLVSFDYR